jgi:hypothetical protein
VTVSRVGIPSPGDPGFVRICTNGSRRSIAATQGTSPRRRKDANHQAIRFFTFESLRLRVLAVKSSCRRQRSCKEAANCVKKTRSWSVVLRNARKDRLPAGNG